jgi:hypothetical protein
MKKYIYSLFSVLLAAVVLTSCTENEGTTPGNDPNPVVTIYKYQVAKPLNPDNDVTLRFAANNKTEQAYYLAEKTADMNTHVTSMGEEGYKDYVVQNGIKLNDISGVSNADVTLTDLAGEYTITAVAVGSGKKTSAKVAFTGLIWTDVATGTYNFFLPARTGMASNATILQSCTSDSKLYRFKDVFGPGYHLKINLLDITATDAGGEYTYFRIPATETPFTYGSYGTISVRDVGYWQGSDAFVTEGGYESGMYADYYCFLMIQYFVSAGNLGYNYDEFVPD